MRLDLRDCWSFLVHLLVNSYSVGLASGLESKLVICQGRMIHPAARAGFPEAIPTKRAYYDGMVGEGSPTEVQMVRVSDRNDMSSRVSDVILPEGISTGCGSRQQAGSILPHGAP